MAAVLALLTDIGSDWRLCQLCWLWLTLIGTCVLLSTKIDPDWFMIRFCWAWLNTIDSCFDSVDTDWHWLAHMSTLSTNSTLICSCVDSVEWNWTDQLMCRFGRLWLTLFRACVEFDDCGWAQLAQVSSVSSLTDPDCLIYRLSVNWNCSWYAQVSKLSSLSTVINLAHMSILSIVINPDWRLCQMCWLRLNMCRLCRYWSTRIG